MKKNSKKVGTQQQKPEIGEVYKIYEDRGLNHTNLMIIREVKNEIAYYSLPGFLDHRSRWNFIKYPEHLKYKLTSLEAELI